MTQLQSSIGSSALGKYNIAAFEKSLHASMGQYAVAPPRLRAFLARLREFASKDRRTMYVGVTPANIYDGDARYLFSLYTVVARARGSILSYAMMMADTLGSPVQSRPRLIERIAKELAPASLKSLEIPRATDPTDSYSYADGVTRLDQKTLKLSPPVAAALDNFRR